MTVKNILLTGASGRIGRTFFNAMNESWRFVLTDLSLPAYDVPSPHRFIPADLSLPGVAAELLRGETFDAVIHLAGIPDAGAAFEDLLPANILSTTYLLEAVSHTPCPRFIFASSAQTIEGYPEDVQIHPGMAVAPANLYGVTKCYGEALCSFYATQRGISCVALRIGAFETRCAANLKNARDYSAWLSPEDGVRLLTAAVTAENITFFIGYGISDNRFKRFDLSQTREVLGYQPRDNAFSEFVPEQPLF
ncbi:NAD(P)-dependent oxidoreductase [Erwinia persicina]|uniref:NAD-dependent epimerase/dehydratase family protein n=1 Tax=Erwinia persicina TaxID=55211 RepID=UPI00210EF8C6|nr:NAD(P)-dependent oxidoreductase [Erwinia persicina]MCQ4092799.1 NAD(P)-dependent oxidoreductase [Erwinia persicina]MCQ4100594.1 NAD(P)-dependent oxidoreductase [Erwinia persicina]